jgi:hypothetical protein
LRAAATAFLASFRLARALSFCSVVFDLCRKSSVMFGPLGCRRTRSDADDDSLETRKYSHKAKGADIFRDVRKQAGGVR